MKNKTALTYKISNTNIATISQKGIVTLKSKIGTFKITITAKETDLYNSASKVVTVIVKRYYPKVLIVDTSYLNVNKLRKKFISCGFTVVWKSSMKGVNVKDYDALAIPGGGDVTPSLYNASRNSKTYGTNVNKDKIQIAAVKAFMAQKNPYLVFVEENSS